MTDITLSNRFSPMYDRSDSPDSPWFATAISGFRNRVSICPQLLNGSRGWSVEVESPAMYSVGTPSAFSTSTLATAPKKERVIRSSQAAASDSFSRGFSRTSPPPAICGRRTFTRNDRFSYWPAAVRTFSTISRRSSAFMVVTAGVSATAHGHRDSVVPFGRNLERQRLRRRRQRQKQQRNHFAFSTSTANVYVGPSMLERKITHFSSGEKLTLGSRR